MFIRFMILAHLKNNQRFNQSINIIQKYLKTFKDHELYPKAKDGRGIAYEQIEK